MQRLRAVKRNDFKVAMLPAVFAYSEEDPGTHLAAALAEMVNAAEQAIRDGASLLIISDRDISPKQVAIPSLLATSALHHGLLERQLRSATGIIVESGDPREVMHFCLLLGYGANAINPYMAFEGIYKLRADGDLPEDEPLSPQM